MNKQIALGAALMFASHPIHVESVSAVVNMAEALSGIFYVAGYISFLSTTSNQSNRASTIKIVCLMFTWSIFAVISILFKETGA
jgi:hypothetical protein